MSLARITWSHVAAVQSVWLLLVSRCDPRDPIVQITADGAVQFAWNRGRYYIDVDVSPDGTLAWFWRDRETDESDGTENERELPDSFWKQFALASSR